MLAGQIKPGAVLSEIELARRWGISRAPIREAIRQLEQENLVRASHHRSATVVGITAASVRDIYEVRVVLESLSARLVAERAEDAEMAELKRLADAVEESHGARDYRSAIAADDEFHRKLAYASRNRILDAQLARVLDRLMMARMMVREEPGRVHEIAREHRAIVEAITAHDPAGAGEAMAVHVREAGTRLIDRLIRTSVDED